MEYPKLPTRVWIACLTIFVIVLWFNLSNIKSKFIRNNINVDVPVCTESRPLHLLATSEVNKFEEGYTENEDDTFLNFLRIKWIHGPSKRQRTLTNPNKRDYSQVGQSMFLDKFLNQRKNGFFVEAGAHDGENLSNTLFFEKERNWTGLLAEANPKRYSQIMSKNRRAYYSPTCLSPQPKSMRAKLLMADEGGGITNTLAKAHVDLLKNMGFQKEQVVQCFPLYALLRAIGRSHVDYFSLDVEGAELMILNTIPFDKVTFSVIGVEYGRHSPAATAENVKNVRAFFAKIGGYKEIGSMSNMDIFFARIKDIH